VATAGMQEKSVAGLLADLGVTGFGGIAATIDGTVNTTIDVTVSAGAWAVLADGTILASELVTTTLTGNTTNGTTSLWLDYATGGAQGTSYTPAWSVAASAPSTNAIKIATVVISGAVLSSVTMVGTGLQGLTQQLTFKPTTPTFPATTAFVQNTTGADVIVYLGLSGVTATHLYINSTNSATGALDLITQAPSTFILPKNYYFSATYSAGTPTWVWQGKRTG
jgi:hypothetical protein